MRSIIAVIEDKPLLVNGRSYLNQTLFLDAETKEKHAAKVKETKEKQAEERHQIPRTPCMRDECVNTRKRLHECLWGGPHYPALSTKRFPRGESLVVSQSLKCVFCSRNAKCCGESCCIRMLCVVLLDTSTPMAPPQKKQMTLLRAIPTNGIWLSGIGGGGGVMGFWKRPGDLAVGYRRWGGVMGLWKHLGIWLSGIGGGGGSWDSGATWGFGCRV